MGPLYGLSAALGFGLADFAATNAARRTGVLRTAFTVQLIGLLGIAAVLAIRGEAPNGSPATWMAMLGAAIVDFGGMLLLYRAFAVGTLSLVSPVASGFAVVTAALALAAGERPPGLAMSGTALLVFGVVVVSRTRSEGAASLTGMPEAVGAALMLGTYFWMLGELTPSLGVHWPVFATRAVVMILTWAMLLWQRERAFSRDRSLIPVFTAAGLLDTIALLSFNLGVDSAYITTTTALTSLYSAVTVLLAWAVLRERLARSQWAGIGVVLAGVLLVSI